MDTRLILHRLYRLDEPHLTLARRLGGRVRRVRRKLVNWVGQRSTRLALGALAVGGWIAGHIYYYNRLYDLETNVYMAEAQIQAAEQKRSHIQRNLVKLVRYYATYERSVMNDLTVLRTQDSPKPPTSDGDSAQQLLARLDAVAEQYPNLNLTQSVQQLSEIIADTETEIVDRIGAYNEAVNIYTTYLGQFPANIFGRPLGFERVDYYRPKDPSVVDYREVAP